MDNRIRTIILDDEYFSRQALLNILKEINEYIVVGIYKFPKDALNDVVKKKPDLIIVDAMLGNDKNAGPNWVRNVRKILPKVSILGVTNFPECLENLKAAGCNDALIKGRLANSEEFTAYLKEARFQSNEYISVSPPELDEEEKMILEFIRDGKKEKEIAVILYNDETKIKRVKDVKKSMFNKFGAINAFHLISLAYDFGILKPRYVKE